MNRDQVHITLALARQLMEENPDRAGDLVMAMQAGLLAALKEVQGQRGDYASALSNLSQLFCEKKPSSGVIKMTSDAIRRADGEGSCPAMKHVLAELDKREKA